VFIYKYTVFKKRPTTTVSGPWNVHPITVQTVLQVTGVKREKKSDQIKGVPIVFFSEATSRIHSLPADRRMKSGGS
jgi:hypothetical protein